MEDPGSFGDSLGDLLGDSCGCSECVSALSLGVPFVTGVSVSSSSVCVAW